ncbi:MAG: hypothetical protein DHS20C20_19610 [Ardenticatenaceae bacterium]|nr:MAG: hypothetical protein DHS20C20_19610 [Ardenticatenaceae bacterium]
MSFEWQTEEDESGWEKEPVVPESPPPRRRWRFLLGSLLGLLAVFLLVRWQVNRQVSEATGTVETEILTTHKFVLQTAVSQDEPLFSANLSGRDPDWTVQQKALFAEGLFVDRPMFGWQLDTDSADLSLDDVTIQLEPDLHGAEVIFPQNYIVQASAGVTETITLQQTAVYRLGTNRWLYSPPEDEFWGDWITLGGDYLTLVYPERDRKLAASLGVRLDKLLGQMCDELADLNCPSDFQVHLRLSTSPEALLAINEIETVLDAGLQLNLPTLTLIGLPTDDASKEMVYRAYGVQLATAVFAHQVTYDCCHHQLFFRALRDYQLAELDLQPWPLVPEMFQQMIDSGFDGDVARHWTRGWEQAPPQFLLVWNIEDPDPIWQQVYMWVEFLVGEETAVSPTQMMRLMDRNSYSGWLADVLQSSANLFRLDHRFLLYISQQTTAAQQAAPPIPLPTGTITLVCQRFGSNITSHVYDYNLSRKSWTERFRGEFEDMYASSIDGKQFIATESSSNFFEEAQRRIFLVTDDESVLIEEMAFLPENEHWLNYNFADQMGDFLVRFETVEGKTDIQLLPTACAGTPCTGVPLEGYPRFSANNEYLLVEALSGEQIAIDAASSYQHLQTIYLMTPDGQIRQQVGTGGIPFWINNETYGYVRQDEAGGWEVVTAVTNQNEPRFLIDLAKLLSSVAANNRPDDLTINQIVVNPNNPQELLLQLNDEAGANRFGNDISSYLFTLRLSSDLAAVDEVKLLRRDEFSGVLVYWGDGRTIAHSDFSFQGPEVTWYFFDAVTGQTELTFNSIYYLPGTDDGQWVVQFTENYLLLRAPEYHYQQFIPHTFEDCSQMFLSVEK